MAYKHTPELNAWSHMKNRCYNPNDKKYPIYGGRGIIVCDHWKNSFSNFLADMGERPSSKYSLDRVNVHGNYEPQNCRWATSKEQARNKTNNRIIEYNGVSKVYAQWIEDLGIDEKRLSRYLKKHSFDDFMKTYEVDGLIDKRKLRSKYYKPVRYFLGKTGVLNPKSKPVKQIDVQTGEVIATYAALAEATRLTGATSIFYAVNHPTRTAKGFRWEYVNDNDKKAI
jgi:hypothetical protein